ncbi:EAL domain-containing protein [Pseudomonas fluorescens]|uniref:EAL domain-containing protein n=1 Tax=Pseudomonas edaphica TaxID=2006980 RepID=A0A7Y7RQT3_9PSED|nr:EAL domain-containing protein [Pseudomonas sp. L13]MBD8093286.1 EAL domain-containing protein [Pseudomonas fluorescens]MBD8719239.1 EAL domain-containing protein [Pseudomonas fluorescens]NMX56249.1 EAL domain-containing protein [Pseudomonas sp. WS 5146]NVZ55835.1 EAL domain-containing protein [Pseudomonas edaphica]
MKVLKRVFNNGHSIECPLASESNAPSRHTLSSQFKITGAYGVLWLISALLMAWAALYAAEHLAAMYVAENMRDIIDLGNGNFSAYDPEVLNELSALGNYDAITPAHWPTLLAKTYAFIEYCILLFVWAAGLFSILAVFKVSCSAYAFYFSLEAKFRRAIVNGELDIRYQPMVDMKTGMWTGAEALLRWTHKGQVVSPALFIPLIERSGLMPLTTRWVCQRVIEDYSRLIWACDRFYVSINLSAQDVLDSTFAGYIEQLLAQYRIPASRIVFEVTEGVMLDKQAATVQLDRLRALGHKIALDDFGTGYSNLSYLDCLPLDIIKIDRSFVTRKDDGPANMVLVHLLDMAWHLNLKVIVEGIETSAQVKRLLALGALTGQGWFYSKDLAAEELVNGYFSLVHPDMNRVI